MQEKVYIIRVIDENPQTTGVYDDPHLLDIQRALRPLNLHAVRLTEEPEWERTGEALKDR